MSYFQTNVLSKFSFTNCNGCGFIKYFNMQRISKRKTFLLYSIDTTALPEDHQSVTSGLRGWVQPAKPDLHIRLLYEVLPKVYVFSEHRYSRLFVFLFLIEYLISSSWLCLRSMCSIDCWHEPKGAMRFP